MSEIIAVIVVGVMSFYAGWVTRERQAVRRVNELMQTVTEEIMEQADKIVMRISIEHHNGVYYVYDMDDKTFMAQGATRKELETALAGKFPGKTFAATHDNLVEVGFVNESV
jgi:hypothetical protein